MLNKTDKNKERQRRHARVRTKVSGTPECPRLNVFRSNANIHVQVIDDVNKVTFKRYTEKDGLINNIVYGVLVDDDNNIWMSTNGGISRFSEEDKKFNNFLADYLFTAIIS